MESDDKQKSYQSDIHLRTNNEFGFDYLRDNMATQVASASSAASTTRSSTKVDSILIDEARTPLIISGRPRTPPSSTQDQYAHPRAGEAGERRGAGRLLAST